MKNWEFLLLMAVGMGLLFYALNAFGMLVSKSGTFLLGGAMGTRDRFWGEYQRMCGTISKNFRITSQYTVLTVRLETCSGSARVEILGSNKAVLYAWHACGSLEKQVDCRELRTCRVRITSEDFCGKFDIFLQ